MARSLRQFLLPDLGEGLEDAEVVQWRVDEGDRVELNQILVEVNTEKALVEIPAPWPGVVERLHAEEGEVVKVGQPLVSIRVEGAVGVEAPPAGGEAGTKEAPKRRAVLVGYGVDEEEDAPRHRGRSERRADRRVERTGPIPASPPVRRLAKEMGIDLGSVKGSGPNGRITREDVMGAAQAAPDSTGAKSEEGSVATSTAGKEQRIAVRGTRRMIAEKMARSIREIPHVTTFLTVDATWLEALRREISSDTGERITALPIVVRALVEVCEGHPKLNSSFDADRSEIVIHGGVHVGIAADTEHGLLVPVVHDAGGRGILDLSREITRLGEVARSGKARPEDLVGSTVTVTNVGTFGAEFGTPIINHPEAAILALGVIEPRALVADGRVEARPATTLSLSFDHRVMDGAEAGRALRALGAMLESPFRLGALPR